MIQEIQPSPGAFRLEQLRSPATRPLPFGTLLVLRCPHRHAALPEEPRPTVLKGGRLALIAPSALEDDHRLRSGTFTDFALTHAPHHAIVADRELAHRVGSLAGAVVPLPEPLAELALAEARAHDRPAGPLGQIAVTALGELEASLSRLPGRTPRGQASLYLRLYEARGYLESEIAEPRSCSEAARLANLSRAHFIRLFRSLFHCPPKELRQRRRDALACELLAATRLSTVEIARRCGFSDRTAFHRSFRERMGMTPGEWRRRHCPAGAGSPREAGLRTRDEDDGERFPLFA